MSLLRLSLTQQIVELDDPTPVDVDPEDEERSSPAPIRDTVGAREHYLEVGTSAFRRQLDSVVDPKYVGVKTSRKQLEEANTLGIDFEDSPGPGGPESRSATTEGNFSGDEDDEALSIGKGNDSDVEQQPIKNSQGDESRENDISIRVRQRIDEDRKKGRAVSKQLSLWDSLLDARIRLQKSVTASNRLPHPTQISELTSHPRCLQARHMLLGEILALVDELSALRDVRFSPVIWHFGVSRWLIYYVYGRQEFMKEYGKVQWHPRKRRRIQDDSEEGRRYTSEDIDNIDRDWEVLIREMSEDAAGLEHAYHPHLTRILEKWSAKVAAVAPSALLPASRKKFSQVGGSLGGVKSVGTQIEEVLQREWPILLSRTQLARSKGLRVTSKHDPGLRNGEEAGDNEFEEDMEIFDDTDFYQQLLRDVIDSKGVTAGQAMNWMAGQKHKKSKKDVDTKASKGRKLRFVPCVISYLCTWPHMGIRRQVRSS
ncbi:apoptosis antagonizing transcription factor-domain-containing protein [Multifurca ochricompacta]|uniref:Protein BFR2 n=1 Tax=Multifurca ochricompacta TaxID=376703 RepID=A0AAD4QPS8_9AGAM|nr:apoptosis antagonizing transcription factor-domain-containing protein [Multifurca ochricompacta]